MRKELKFILLPVFVSLCLSHPPHLVAQSKADCLVCHSDRDLSKEENGKPRSLFVEETLLNRSSHKKLVCIACHTGFNPDEIPHKETITTVNCMTCHKDAAAKHPFHPQMAQAVRQQARPDISCKNCHGTHEVVSPKTPGSKFYSDNLTESCGTCHSEVKKSFVTSEHAKAFVAGMKSAPTCIVCHRNDITRVRQGRDSTQLKIAQEKVCLSCHLDDPEVRARTGLATGFIAAYEKSVHGKALLNGNAAAANCVNCHGSHEMKKSLDPTAHIHKSHIVETCGQCHSAIAAEFSESVHGIALGRGKRGAPVCTDCHGEHNILSPGDPRSPVAPLNVSGQVCSPCHSSLRLSEKYGIRTDRFQTFSDSYHGLAIRAGSVEVANCASCHGAHKIKHSNDPASMVHKANLAETCGACHAGANERFGIGAVHVTMTAEEDPVLYWIATLYIILIVSVVGGMTLHNVLDFVKKSRRKFMIRRGYLIEEHVGHSLYLRMSLNERLQHGALLISFITLVITGFMLRYPDAWWVVGIRNLSSGAFDFRSLLHRIAGVLMIAASAYHLYYILFTERGKQLVRDLVPKFQDVYDAIAVFRYNIGLSKHKPQFGRFSYVEKSEYWALVWGTVIMGATGFIMWFDNTFIGLLTKLGYDVARTVHFYEAWLATLAILVWHFYYVLFNPDIYPMNLAWLTGALTEAEMQEEHPLELEEIKEQKMKNAKEEEKNAVNKQEIIQKEMVSKKSDDKEMP